MVNSTTICNQNEEIVDNENFLLKIMSILLFFEGVKPRKIKSRHSEV